jgi:hypothetical protein
MEAVTTPETVQEQQESQELAVEEMTFVNLVASDGVRVPISYKALMSSETLSTLCEDVEMFDKLMTQRRVLGEIALEEATTADQNRVTTLRASLPAAEEFEMPVSCVGAEVVRGMVAYMEHFRNRAVVPADTTEPGVGGAKPPPVMDDYEREFVKFLGVVRDTEEATKDARNNMLFDMILASNHLKVIKLLSICAYTVANSLRGKTPEQIRAEYHIEDDFTPEERASILKENEWIAE